MFLVHIKEFWNWNIDFVLSPNKCSLLLFDFTGYSFSILIKFDRLINWKWNRGKSFSFSIVQKALFI